MEAALAGYQAQHTTITAKIAELRRMLGKAGAASGGGTLTTFPKKRTLGPAARQRIAAAQRKRWAEYRKKQRA
jgi:hypothetical protein